MQGRTCGVCHVDYIGVANAHHGCQKAGVRASDGDCRATGLAVQTRAFELLPQAGQHGGSICQRLG